MLAKVREITLRKKKVKSNKLPTQKDIAAMKSTPEEEELAEISERVVKSLEREEQRGNI